MFPSQIVKGHWPFTFTRIIKTNRTILKGSSRCASEMQPYAEHSYSSQVLLCIICRSQVFAKTIRYKIMLLPRMIKRSQHFEQTKNKQQKEIYYIFHSTAVTKGVTVMTTTMMMIPTRKQCQWKWNWKNGKKTSVPTKFPPTKQLNSLLLLHSRSITMESKRWIVGWRA